ncbi:hypothetical protein ENSA5_00400 [Enhygromyxa salina]|uniref:DUF6484 domain-containing protein n=1 Tax=Enhygromyxa salina TaxID=215803 RepID=A0A2S9YLA4_9BACT|nr:DUF6484 domain-containing protein [Enhygromyxa salina]PRQ05889.1 hypothetical protein ENSA5_00400 [Enhygromyxa salina]
MSAPASSLIGRVRRGPELATIVAIVDHQPRVRLHDGEQLLVALSLVPIGPSEFGRDVALEFIAGDPTRPLILGLVESPTPSSPTDEPAEPAEPVELEVDGHRVIVHARQELSIRCGKASITLDANGRVVIKAVQILTQASGSHRIRVSSIQLN